MGSYHPGGSPWRRAAISEHLRHVLEFEPIYREEARAREKAGTPVPLGDKGRTTYFMARDSAVSHNSIERVLFMELKEEIIVISKDSVKNLLAFLETKYPDQLDSIESIKKSVPPNVNQDELFRLLHFCWEENFIKCSPIEESGNVVDFHGIRITGTGIRFLRGI